MGWNNGSSVPTQYFSEVPSTHYAAESLQTACDAGYVAKAETFGPSEPIKLSDALKLSVCGSGYLRLAEAAGGYPAGYRLQAAEIGLMKDLKDKSAELLSYRDAAVLLYNCLLYPSRCV